MSELRPCPLCSEHLWPCNEGFEHPASDTCPLDNMWFPERLVAAWNRRRDLTPTLSAAMQLPEVKALVETMAGLKRIVEEIDGAMNHGTWRDEKGMRLKDTPEWVSAYVALAAIKETKT